MFLKKFTLFYIIFISSPSFTFAASLQVNPVNLEIGSNQSETNVELINRGQQETSYKITAFRWKCYFGNHRFEDTEDLIIYPSLINIKPGNKKNISIKLGVPVDPCRGAIYRLSFKEIENPQNKFPSENIKSMIHVSIPVVVDPVNPLKPQASWTLRSIDKGKFLIGIKNIGEGHISLREIALKVEGEKKVLFKQAMTYYVVPNAKKEFGLNLPCSLINIWKLK